MKCVRNWKPLLLEVLVLLSVLVMILHPAQADSYRRYATDTIHYVRGQVVQVVSEELEESPLGTGQKLGIQELEVELTDGQAIPITNYLTETHNVLTKEGQWVVVCVDAPENTQPYYTVFNYDRTPALAVLILVFLAFMLLVGRRKGFDAALAILFTLVFFLRVTLPALYSGVSPVAMGFLVVILSTAVTLTLLHGFTRQCALGVGVTLLGELAACLLFGLFSGLLHLTGFQTDSAEGLLLIAQSTGLQVRTLLFAGTMVSALGAVMDVAVSVLSALREVALASPDPKRRDLFRAGIRLGQDMIGTMSNTLIFAFTGGALATMLVFYSYGVQVQQLLSSDYLTVELAQGLCSTAAVVLTVPLAALVGSAAYSRKGK